MTLLIGSLLSASASAESQTYSCPDNPYAYIHCGTNYYKVCNKQSWEDYNDQSAPSVLGRVAGAVGGLFDWLTSTFDGKHDVIKEIKTAGGPACFSLYNRLQSIQKGNVDVQKLAVPESEMVTTIKQYTVYGNLGGGDVVGYIHKSAEEATPSDSD